MINMRKNKKILKLSVFSSFFVVATTIGTSLALTSCAVNSEVNDIPTINTSSFTSLNTSILPVVASSLSSKTGQDALLTSYINKVLYQWFKSINDSSIEATYSDWEDSANSSYKDKYEQYQNSGNKNWKQLFQQEVLDPAGGTKESFIQSQINNNLKSTFIDNIFNDNISNYLAYNSTPVGDLPSSVLDLDNTYVNASITGTKNNFSFNANAIQSNIRKTLDFGYADFLNFLMDSWIKNTLPLPLSMSLWKNGTNASKIKSLFSDFFTQNSTPDGYSSGSYAFQYFESSNNDNLQTLSTTGKFKQLIDDLANGKYVSNTNGLIELPNDYTEDSSTILITPATNLFDGTYVTPFSAAAWYKLSNYVFGITDSNVQTLSKIDDNFILGNFLYIPSTSQTSQPKNDNVIVSGDGVFNFPYQTKWTNPLTQQESSVFNGKYSGATGIIDTVNLDEKTTILGQDSTNQGQQNKIVSQIDDPGTSAVDTPSTATKSNLGKFILTRNSFGVHLIGIDRISKLKEAYDAKSSQGFKAGFDSFCNELRNTFMYYYAVDTINNTTTYKVQDSLKQYLTDNFNSIILAYLEKLVNNPSNEVNNLFSAKVVLDNKNLNNYTTNLGFPDEADGKNYKDYYSALNEIKSGTNFKNLLDSIITLNNAKAANDFNNKLKDAIYNNQSTLNNNANASAWVANGISGVLPYKRDNKTGDFTSLMQLVNSITTNTKPENSSANPPATESENKKTKNIVNSNNYRNITKANEQLKAINSNSSITTPKNTRDYLTNSKNNYQNNLVTYLNSINLVVEPKVTTGKNTYIYTNNDYINNALISVGSDGTLNSIVYNFYMQKYLYPDGYQKDNSIANSNSTVIGSTSWIANKIKSAIQNTYYVANFTNNKNLYSQGDWTNINDFYSKANSYWSNNWSLNEYQYSLGADKSFNSYEIPKNVDAYYKFLVTIKYLLGWNQDTKIFDFSNSKLYDLLNSATTVETGQSGKAMVAWKNVSSKIGNPDFGTSNSVSNISDIQSKAQTDATFKALPIYLTNTNSYSWAGSKNPYELINPTQQNEQPNVQSKATSLSKTYISYTNSSDYWYSAPMTTSSTSGSETLNTGFLGFQFENNNDTGLTANIVSDAFKNSTYSSAIGTNINYYGMLYSYGSRQSLVDYVNGLSTVSLLTDFYDNNLRDSGLPINESSKTEITNIIEGEDNNRVTSLQAAITKILNDQTQVPDNAFSRMQSMPIWNKNNGQQSTLFSTSTDTPSLVSEYVITQFNNNDVKNLLDSNKKLNTNSNGFLGLGATTFFNAVVMLANSSTKLQNQAIDAMNRSNGKISVYDIRLINVLDSNWIANYDVWQKIKSL